MNNREELQYVTLGLSFIMPLGPLLGVSSLPTPHVRNICQTAALSE